MSDEAPDLIGHIVGFRGFHLEAATDSQAFVQNWRPGQNKAHCRANGLLHNPPEVDCDCGYYVWADFDRTQKSHWQSAYGTIIGAVKAHGRVMTSRKGFRAEYAEIIAFWDGSDCVGDIHGWANFGVDANEEVLYKLSMTYEVPILSKSEIKDLAQKVPDNLQPKSSGPRRQARSGIASTPQTPVGKNINLQNLKMYETGPGEYTVPLWLVNILLVLACAAITYLAVRVG